MSLQDDRLKNDFRQFLYVVWQHINLPDPTPLQYDIANYLQHGPNKCCIQAFRGVGKSFITSAYVLWELYKDPQKKILVISASKSRSDAFTTFTLRLIEEMPILQHLRPRDNQRASRVEFDVGPAIADQSPSVRSLGITSQIAGSRADIIIPDDVEVPNNSMTADLREKLLERIKEFSAVLKPLPGSRIVYLGTPQTEDSIYNKLAETFETRIWPAEIPTVLEAESYGESLSPYVKKLMEKHAEGTPTDPKRFHAGELAERRAEYGRAGYSLQFMLNTRLSDEDRYPLKVRDWIVSDIDAFRAPMRMDWLPDVKRELKLLPNCAMAGDRFYSPGGNSEEFSDYQGSVMSIDPSGRGKDETGYAVVKLLNGYLYVRRAGGFPGGYDLNTLTKLATIAKEEKVNHIVVEANFGDGMYSELLKPVLAKIHPCIVEEVKHSTQKERRIIDTLEPVMSRHRLVIDKSVIEDDYRTAQAYEGDARVLKTLVYQLTRVCYDRGALKFDDRLDALAIAVAYWTETIAQDEDDGIASLKAEALERELERYMEHTLTLAPRGGTKYNSVYGR